MDLIFRCIGCGKSERKVLEDPVIFEVPSNVDSGIFLSRECCEVFCRSYVPNFVLDNRINFFHKSCRDLYALSDD